MKDPTAVKLLNSMANSWAYRMPEAIMTAAPSMGALEVVLTSNRGMTIADRIPTITITKITSTKVMPER